MPIYSYACPVCGAKKDVLQKSSDPAPKCEHDQAPMQKQLTTPAFNLKGGGWYKPGASR